MENYIIWLDSGECIEGTATKNECLRLKEAYCNFKNGKTNESYKCYEIKDDDGTAWVDFNKVQAIAINKNIKNKEVGFKS
ncbi:hypothetical protein [Clostridium coskatii]|uniref:Uncharacterized protein n=1 Tax=Clostridium coskatii TaxID=1705578 RepID=A0A162JBE7_9CLOT|nr:hypothetical protein [Clostridium coskatii]OAA93015.1 hypothetical protein WX73_00333 [Clostridium coskatii]OBR90443.1 hypothetical protein CLCOS_40010 [Clostridium coskatii]